MLDFLLIRPVDHRLWRHNVPDTLRYLVVDELHTFDGAQGTDLACLVRRLRSTLDVTRERLISVGTSATIGGIGESSRDLLDYVSRIFVRRFDVDAVVGEVRQSIDEFFGSSLISRSLLGRDDLTERAEHTRYASLEDCIRAQHDASIIATVGDRPSPGCRWPSPGEMLSGPHRRSGYSPANAASLVWSAGASRRRW